MSVRRDAAASSRNSAPSSPRSTSSGDEVSKSNFGPERRDLLRLQAVSGRTAKAVLLLETAGPMAGRRLPGRHYSSSPGR